MSHKLFKTTDRNPNDEVGGGGCVCSPAAQPDCVGPYAVFPGNDMESPLSPHVVLCLSCAEAVVNALTVGEIGRAGEETVDATCVEDEAIPEI